MARYKKKDETPQDTKKTNQDYNAYLAEIACKEEYDHHDLEKMRELYQHYLDVSAKYDMRLSNQSLALALGVNYNTLKGWKNDERERKNDPERAKFIEFCWQTMAAYREQLALDGKINPATLIFWQKNFDGMRDMQEQTVHHEIETVVDVESLKERYKAMEDNVIDVEAHVKESKTQVIDYKKDRKGLTASRPKVTSKRAQKVKAERKKIKEDAKDTFI